MPRKKTIGERIAMARKRLKLTRLQTANEMEVTPISIYRWENGLTVPMELFLEHKILPWLQRREGGGRGKNN